jgi:hypothetical protein
MKKILFLLSVATMLSVTSEKAFAQFEKGDKLLNAGIDLGGTYGGGGLGVGASFEYGVTDFISVGAQADFITWSYGSFGYKWRYTFFPIAARGSYHFGKHFLKVDNLDLYAGPSLGYYISSYKDNSGYSGVYDNGYGGQVLFGVFAGGRYFFKPNMGVFAEVGYNAAPLKAGITFKF